MINLLIEMPAARKQAMDQGQATLERELVRQFERRYDDVIREAGRRTRGERAKRSGAGPGNLVRRLDERRSEVLRFLDDFQVRSPLAPSRALQLP